MPDLCWVAQYNDGTQLPQYPSQGETNRYEDIDRTRLEVFHILRRDTNQKVFSLWLDEGQRLIYRRRNFISSRGSKQSWVLVGTQESIGADWQPGYPVNRQSIAYIHEGDLTIQLAGAFDQEHPLFYDVVLHPEET
jgi:hypothetical protein